MKNKFKLSSREGELNFLKIFITRKVI